MPAALEPAPSGSLARTLRRVLGAGISLIALYLALKDVPFASVGQAFRQADLALVAWTLFVVAANTVAKAQRWRVLMGASRDRLGLWKAARIILAGQALNTVYPARVGDLGRVYAAGTAGISYGFLLGTIIIEKILDLLSYSALLFMLLALSPLPAWVNQSTVLLSVLAVAGFGILLFAASRLDRSLQWLEKLVANLPEGVRRRLSPQLRAGLTSLQVLNDRRAFVALGAWSAFIWATAILNNLLVLRALHLDAPPRAAVLLLVVLQASITVPSIPGRIGLYEYLCVLVLGMFGVGQAAALSYGFLLHAIVLLPSTLLGLLFAGMLPSEKREPETRSDGV